MVHAAGKQPFSGPEIFRNCRAITIDQAADFQKKQFGDRHHDFALLKRTGAEFVVEQTQISLHHRPGVDSQRHSGGYPQPVNQFVRRRTGENQPGVVPFPARISVDPALFRRPQHQLAFNFEFTVTVIDPGRRVKEDQQMSRVAAVGKTELRFHQFVDPQRTNPKHRIRLSPPVRRKIKEKFRHTTILFSMYLQPEKYITIPGMFQAATFHILFKIDRAGKQQFQ